VVYTGDPEIYIILSVSPLLLFGILLVFATSNFISAAGLGTSGDPVSSFSDTYLRKLYALTVVLIA
jgi:hypothetical protein